MHGLLVEDSTDYVQSYLLKEKLELKSVMLGLIKNLKTKYVIHVTYGARTLEKMLILKGFEIHEWMRMEFEDTILSIPQQNGNVEQKLATLITRACTMLCRGKFSAFPRNGLWAEAANTATLLENNLVTPNKNLSLFKQFLGRKKKHSVFGAKL